MPEARVCRGCRRGCRPLPHDRSVLDCPGSRDHWQRVLFDTGRRSHKPRLSERLVSIVRVLCELADGDIPISVVPSPPVVIALVI
jgi:hypothetical protein